MSNPVTRKSIPNDAARFTAPVKFADDSADNEISILARSADPIQHWFWGKNVHDFSGMKIPDRIPLDHNHDSEHAIGFADKFDVADGLKICGKLTPFKADDKASEIIHQRKAGVPYQASIFFDPNELVVEDVPSGMSTQVNGKKFDGPGVIFRQSVLRGVAVCLYGADRHTSCDMKFSATQFNVSMFKEPVMAEAVETPVVEEVVEETPKTELNQKPKAPKAKQKTGPEFLSAFGSDGGVWFAEGKSFDEAQTLFNAKLVQSNKDLETKLAAANQQITALRGEKEPISADLAEKERDPVKEKQAAELSMKLGSETAAKAAMAIKLPV